VLDDEVPADRLQVLDRGDESREQLVQLRAGLEPVLGRPYLVRAPRLRKLAADEREAEMRPVELGRRRLSAVLDRAHRYAESAATAQPRPQVLTAGGVTGWLPATPCIT